MATMINFTGLGTEQLVVSDTSVGFAALPAQAQYAMIRVRGANIFMENDGTPAAAGAGMQVDDGSFIDLTDGRYSVLANFQFIRAACTDATLDVSYFS